MPSNRAAAASAGSSLRTIRAVAWCFVVFISFSPKGGKTIGRGKTPIPVVIERQRGGAAHIATAGQRILQIVDNPRAACTAGFRAKRYFQRSCLGLCGHGKNHRLA